MAVPITRDDLRTAIDDGSVVVLDALPAAPYGQRHLPGAINLAIEDVEGRSDSLPERAATVVAYSTDVDCTRAPELAERLESMGYEDVRLYREGIEDWVAAGLPVETPRAVELDLDDMRTSPTAALFEGFRRAGVDVSIFVTRTAPGRSVGLHVHPYAEVFVVLEGRGRWTYGDEVVELEPERVLVVPPETPHGFRNVGDETLLVVAVHERGTMRQTWLGEDPA
jgi:mannose-6-phosphate isomerase-like protein (cupin superfamily)